MFWADKLLENRKNKELINDAWTPSGIIHMGGLKGPIIHDTLYKILKSQGQDVKFQFGFDDMDSIDGLPENLKLSHEKYMGIPICDAPSPNGNGSFGDYYGNLMKDLFKSLNVQAEIYLASDYYRKGVYNNAIQLVLDNADKIRKVYAETYKKEIASDWYPLQVVCPNCGKVGTTKVTDWDGKEVSFTCEENMVKWARGCGNLGKVSPFDGRATMPFKVEWAAKWWTFKVTIEGAGKDHASAGGTYDVARKICKDVFGQEPPLALPYEFFLYDGKKMSSSRGLGLTGQDLLEVLPPEIVRFLMIRTNPNQAVEFNPFGTQIIPKLYEDYQGASEEFESNLNSENARAFELSVVDAQKKPLKVRFLTLAQWVQMPNMENEIRKEGLGEWAKYARVWVEKYAPEEDKFLVQKNLPESVKNLKPAQKEYLQKLAGIITENMNAEEFQQQIYSLSKDSNISSKEAFSAVYTALLGKDHGPKAAWLISSLDPEFVRNRFIDASK